MSAPVRIQRKRTKGWKMPPNTVSVTRPGPWGNPFRMNEKPDKRMLRLWGWKLRPGHWDGACPSSQEAVKRFAGCITFDEASHYAADKELRGKNLACFCDLCDHHKDGKPFDVHCDDCAPCHVDVLGPLANGEPTS